MKETMPSSPIQDDQSDTSTDPGLVVIEFNDLPTAEILFSPIEAHSSNTQRSSSEGILDIQSVSDIEHIPPENPAPFNLNDFEQI